MTPEFPGVEKHHDDASERERLVADAVARFVDCQSRGEAVDMDSFCRRHAHLLPELRIELQTITQIDGILEPEPMERPAPGPPEPLPERLSGNKVLGEIGAGGMGRVLLALDERLNRKVAIKVLTPRYWNNASVHDRFMQEARAMAALSHPNIVAIYSLGGADEPPHFVMEYLQGAPLTEAARALNLRQKVELMRKVVLAADFLHRHGIIHRDLKPGNVLVGADLEPRMLDFGLALQLDQPDRQLTRPGEILGTLDYFSPEQARAGASLDARSDIFSLGVILYQLLTSQLPFHGETFQEQVRSLCEHDPPLPRRIDQSIPGDLQNICLKALEKNAQDRYASAREMADDLQRFLSGEPVLAVPAAYARLMSGKIEQHLRELKGWSLDHILSEWEFDSFRKLYERLIEREDAWIMEVRRLSFSQVSLYLGAWIVVLGGALVALFDYRSLAGTPAVLVVFASAASSGYLGIRCWQQGQRRIGVAYLLTFCLLLPVWLMVAMGQYHFLTAFSHNNEKLELFAKFEAFRKTTNAQLWWALLASLPAYVWLRRFTRSSVFSLVTAMMGALLCLVTLLRMGLLEWVDTDPGRVYLYLLPFALVFFLLGGWIERLRSPADSRYFYFVGLSFTLAGLSGVAMFHDRYAAWLKSVFPRTRGQQEYLFIINAGIYLALQYVCDRIPSTQLRWVGKVFRFVIPGHILTSLLLLGLSASELWHGSPESVALRQEARFFELLLPLAACAFIFGSIPKQMKNFLATGLLFLAVAIIRLQQDLFQAKAAWPVSLLVIGIILMAGAANYSRLKTAILSMFRRRSRNQKPYH